MAEAVQVPTRKAKNVSTRHELYPSRRGGDTAPAGR